MLIRPRNRIDNKISDASIIVFTFTSAIVIDWNTRARVRMRYLYTQFINCKFISNVNRLIVTYVLHSEPLGAVSSSICDTFVLIRKNVFFSTADCRTKIKLIFVIGLNRPSMLRLSPLPNPGLDWYLSMYLSSCKRRKNPSINGQKMRSSESSV